MMRCYLVNRGLYINQLGEAFGMGRRQKKGPELIPALPHMAPMQCSVVLITWPRQ